MLLNQNWKECIVSEISSGCIRGTVHLYALCHLAFKSSEQWEGKEASIYTALLHSCSVLRSFTSHEGESLCTIKKN